MNKLVLILLIIGCVSVVLASETESGLAGKVIVIYIPQKRIYKSCGITIVLLFESFLPRGPLNH